MDRIHDLAILGKFDKIKSMLKDGHSIDELSNGSTALVYACSKGYSHHIDEMIAFGADINAQDKSKSTALHYLASYNYIADARDLIKHRPCIDIKDYFGQTPFFISIRNYNFEISEFLLENGADVNTHENAGETALHILAKYDPSLFCSTLMNYGANPFLTNKESYTPLDLAARYLKNNFISAIEKYLLEKEIDNDIMPIISL